MANWICTLYKTATEAQTAINAIPNTTTIQVVPVTDPKAGPCIMVIKSV